MKREGRQGWKGGGGGGGGDTGCRLSVRLSSESSDCSLEFAATCLSATRPPWPGPRRPPSWAVGFRSRAASCVSRGGLPYCSGCCGPLLFRAGLSPYSPSPVQANWGLTSRGRPYSHSGRSYSVRTVLQMSTSLTALVLVLRRHCFQR